MDSKSAKAIAEALMNHANVEVLSSEDVTLKPGETIADLMTARGYKPVGEDCEGCGQHHEWANAEGDVIFAIGTGKPEEAPKPLGKEARQARALAQLDKRIGEVEEALRELRELRESIARPVAARSPLDTLTEIGLAMRARELLQSGP